MNTLAPSPQSAPEESSGTLAPANRWQACPADLTAWGSGPVMAVLDDHAVLDFSGPDTRAFLQGQTTVDIAALAPDAWQLGGYCTAKGRLLAIFAAWAHAEGVRVLLPAGIAPAIQGRLSMFVLRSKVRIADASATWTALGVFGAGASAALAAAGVPIPAGPGQSQVLADDERVTRMPAGAGCAERLVLVIRAERRAHWIGALSGVAPVGPELWWWSQIDAGVPAIVRGIEELFVPQSLNLEVLGGVNFRKGCYPGQEIVARSQYLGKLRRRMFLAHAGALGPDGDIHADGAAEAIGRIVLAAAAPGGGWDLLFECPTDRAQAAGLHAGSADAPPLQLRALPYALFDPTA